MQRPGATEGGGAEAEEPSSSSSSDCVLVVEGSTLDFALQEELWSDFLELSGRCRVVLCCRSTPLQKSQVVQLLREQLGVMTLAVGRTPLHCVGGGAALTSMRGAQIPAAVSWRYQC